MQKKLRKVSTISSSMVEASISPQMNRLNPAIAMGEVYASDLPELPEHFQHQVKRLLASSDLERDDKNQITSRHSRRVAAYVSAFADAINATHSGAFAMMSFSPDRKRQFVLAALLHDIGKIGVPESILKKRNRLCEEEIASIGKRVELIKNQYYESGLIQSWWRSPTEVDRDFSFIKRINKSISLSPSDCSRLYTLRKKQYPGTASVRAYFLTRKEWEHLSIPQGNLTSRERLIIHSHAAVTWEILSRIPWTPDLEHIPEIAGHHHERLDGSGYPEGLRGDSLRLETRILAVVDVYDALVSRDRPYKNRMTCEEALDILRAEARTGHLDPTVVEFFIEKGLYLLLLDPTDR